MQQQKNKTLSTINNNITIYYCVTETGGTVGGAGVGGSVKIFGTNANETADNQHTINFKKTYNLPTNKQSYTMICH
jgi:phage baseplate assembly protein gpV